MDRTPKKHEAHVAEHGLLKSRTPALKAKVSGLSPFGYYSVISSNCGGLSVMLPPIALFLKGLTHCASGFNARLRLRIKKSTGRIKKRPADGEP